MIRSDVTPGTVYAYKPGTHSPIRPLVFLAPLDRDHLYTGRRIATNTSGRRSENVAFERAPSAFTRPGAATDWVNAVGYAAVTLHRSYVDTPVRRRDAIELMPTIAMEDFLAPGREDDGRALEYVVVYSLNHILGPYEEVMKAEGTKNRLAELRRVQEDAGREIERIRADALVDAFDAAVDYEINGPDVEFEYGRPRVVFDLEGFAKIVALLEGHELDGK